ncbi:MAG TPA: MurR/RpiR family transcriptional regulator [Anaerolineales bacterium]|nr:MurR/RpiR family transcriptional regulator [Anaerolineales bacterium]HRQ92851.1 MurR/RpiR family transcriptional regulator [Anaerolineales bacterium]
MPSGTYADRIREARPRLSKSFQRLADYILNSYVQAALLTASQLAHEVDVDAATVVRFAQTLNYSGFPALQDEIKARVLQELLLQQQEQPKADSLRGLTDRAYKEMGDDIERTRRMMDTVPLENLLSALSKAKRVFLVGDEAAAASVRELQRHLRGVGILAHALRAEEHELATALAVASEADLLLALDAYNTTPLLAQAVAQAKASGVQSAVVVGAASYEAARKADIVLEVQRQEPDQAVGIVLVALVHAMGQALRWRFADRYKEVQTKTDKVLRRLARTP